MSETSSYLSYKWVKKYINFKRWTNLAIYAFFNKKRTKISKKIMQNEIFTFESHTNTAKTVITLIKTIISK